MTVREISLLRQSFWFLRHGESQANADNTVAGWLDSELTDQGRRQAEESAARLRDVKLGSICSSPLKRAFETAQIVSRPSRLRVEKVDGLKERRWGIKEGQPMSARGDYFAHPEGSESWEQFQQRTWAALTAIRGVAPILVVGHAGTMRVIMNMLEFGLSDDRIANALPVRFTPPSSSDGRWQLAPLEG